MTKMNISENNFVNITNQVNDLSSTLSKMLFSDTILMIFYLLFGVSANCCAVYVLIQLKRRLVKYDYMHARRYNVMLPIADLTACVVGSSFSIAANTYPVNVYDESLCSFMLGSHSLLANLSGLLTLSFSIELYFRVVFFYGRTQYIKLTKYSTIVSVVFAIAISFPSFIFYGETVIVYNIQNISVSGKICGASRTSDNYSSIKAYPIVVLTIYIIEFFIILTIQIRVLHVIAHLNKQGINMWSGSKFNAMQKKRSVSVGIFGNSKPPDNSEIIDIYADKDCSVVDSDLLICSTCNETKWEIDTRLLASHYDLIMEQHLCLSDNTISNNQTSIKPKYIYIKTAPGRVSCFSRTLQMLSRPILFAVSTFPRAIMMILESNDENFWSELSKTEYIVYYFFYRGYLLQSVLNPFTIYWFDLKTEFKYECCRRRRISDNHTS